MLEKSCSHTYVDPKIDRILSAYFFMFHTHWGEHSMLRKSIGPVLGGLQFYFNYFDINMSLSALSANSISKSG